MVIKWITEKNFNQVDIGIALIGGFMIGHGLYAEGFLFTAFGIIINVAVTNKGK